MQVFVKEIGKQKQKNNAHSVAKQKAAIKISLPLPTV